LTAPGELGLEEVRPARSPDVVRLALADGHNQPHTIAALKAAGIRVFEYEEGTVVRRPRIDVDGVEVKVIRPQDMPQQVALGQFDLAITGRDLVFNHLLQFPTSPIEELADLQRSKYSLAVIAKDVPAADVAGAVRYWRGQRPGEPIRLAAELPHVADHYAREHHFGRYSVVPISGASEGFVPDDAEILIEGIETGSSVKANKLTVLERFFESTICVVANKKKPEGTARRVFDDLVERLRSSVQQPVGVGEGA
jgi:ATP phosphoribosyltransferase